MKIIEIYEPAMCCPTGVCGPSVDPEILMLTAVAKEVNNTDGLRLLRRNLSHNPQAFARATQISEKIQNDGIDVLPITVVDGEIVKEAGYPSIEQFREITGLPLENVKDKAQ